MVAVGHVGAGAGGDLHQGALPQVDGADVGGAVEADPRGGRAAAACLQGDLHVLRGGVAFVGQGELAADALALLHAQLQRRGAGGEAGARFVQAVV